MGNQYSKDQLNDMLKQAGKQFGVQPENLKNKKPEDILKKLKPADAAKMKQIMGNPELTQQILNTPQAKMLMKKLMGEK